MQGLSVGDIAGKPVVVKRLSLIVTLRSYLSDRCCRYEENLMQSLRLLKFAAQLSEEEMGLFQCLSNLRELDDVGVCFWDWERKKSNSFCVKMSVQWVKVSETLGNSRLFCKISEPELNQIFRFGHDIWRSLFTFWHKHSAGLGGWRNLIC